jgi:hypothetical protein
MGATHIRLAKASEDLLTGAVHTAWKRRVEKNAKASRSVKKPAGKSKPAAESKPAAKTKTSPKSKPPVKRGRPKH